jgi:phenylacetate-CoA ligase
VSRPDDLKALPVITKQDIQRHAAEMVADNVPKDEMAPNQTGGSTGSPLKFFVTRQRLYSRKAATIRHDRWSRWDIGQKMGVLWGNRVDLSIKKGLKQQVVAKLTDRRLILDTSNITTEVLAAFVAALKEFRPPVYLAYANAVYLYARYLKERGGEYHRPKAIITSAEVLTAEQRTLIEAVFGCEVFDRYGCRETSIIASECPAHDGLHINAEQLWLEFDYGDVAGAVDRPARVLITDLLNYGMPLIRYRIEDTAHPVAGVCSCGRGLPRLRLDGGRVTDFLVTPEGKIVSGAAMTIYFIATVPGIAQAQIVQKTIDFLQLRLVKGPAFNDDSRRLLESKVREFFGPKMQHEIELVGSIPSTASGKHRFSISELDPMQYLK